MASEAKLVTRCRITEADPASGFARARAPDGETVEGIDGFGAMCQLFEPSAHRGKRVQLSAAVRTVDVTGRAALCCRIDGPASDQPPRTLAFDNMGARPSLSGTTGWARHACVLDVPVEAGAIFISKLLYGGGELFWADVRFEVVDAAVPVTDMCVTHSVKAAPTNLDFSEA